MENHGSVAAVGQNNLTAFLRNIPSLAGNESELTEVTQVVRTFYYPQAQNDSQVIEDVVTETHLLILSAELWGAAMLEAGLTRVFRYTYGVSISQSRAWHSSESKQIQLTPLSPLIHGCISWLSLWNPEPHAELTWSNTFQTAIADFIKDPTSSPPRNWPKYLAYEGNVESGNFVQAVATDSPCTRIACDELWNELLVNGVED
ncbi:hypothetical protein FB45DRAFT_922192 [Roridomyces roridus]|uniref:Uncharacterized protein n=1 Tax=Roridomyces roridus TaxID=1738132 RepID=A0AAD7FIE4_9AGAR|nr:hypothetical protein FB45DRAFT_922192 [Roridomyces roridus]